MAKLITKDIPAPDFTFTDGRFDADKYQGDCVKYIEALRATCTDQDDVVGEIIRWQRADGYAEYMVVNTKPLELVHLDTGDGYEVEAPLIRGLNLSDVRGMVESERRINDLFARS